MPIQDFNRFCDHSFAALLALSPEVAGELGISHVGDHRIAQHNFSAISTGGFNARQALMSQTLKMLDSYDPDQLDEEQQISRQVLRAFLQSGHFGRLRGTDAEAAIHCDQLLNHLNGVQAEMLTCLSEWHVFSDELSLSDYLSRLTAVARVLTDLREQLDARLAAGQIVPAVLVLRVCAELEQWLAIDVENSALFARFCAGIEQVGVSAATRQELQEKALSILRSSVIPAYRELVDYLRESYPHTEHRIGLCRLPDGPAYYQYLLRAATTTDFTPEQIHTLGKAELAKLRENITQELHSQGYTDGAFCARLTAFEQDDAYRLPKSASREDILRLTESIIASIRKPFLSTLGIKPKTPVVVQAIPEHQESNAHSRYTPGCADGSRPGIFYLNLAQLKEQSAHGLTTLTYHETFPGHHVQLTIAQELGGTLPQFRKILTHDAYIEGWAKYAELLPWRQGFNTDASWNLSRKRNELLSTANLVLDTGIHHYGWSREQSISFFSENTASSAEFAAMIVDRIAATPGQVCAYKIGMLRFLAARERMEDALGKKFHLPDFHDEVLRHGSIPLNLLDEQIDKAIARSLAQSQSQ